MILLHTQNLSDASPCTPELTPMWLRRYPSIQLGRQSINSTVGRMVFKQEKKKCASKSVNGGPASSVPGRPNMECHRSQQLQASVEAGR